MPLASISFTSIASENLLGGVVFFSRASILLCIILESFSIGGSAATTDFCVLDRACSYAAVYPLNIVIFPLAL
jgi:hypothetical protein